MALIQLLLLTSLFDAVNTVSLGAYGKVINSSIVLPCSFCSRGSYWTCPVWSQGTLPFSPFSPCLFTSSPVFIFYFSLSFIGFTYFLLLSIPSLSTRIVPLHFQAGGCRKRPNLGLVCFVCVICIPCLCYLYSLV